MTLYRNARLKLETVLSVRFVDDHKAILGAREVKLSLWAKEEIHKPPCCCLTSNANTSLNYGCAFCQHRDFQNQTLSGIDVTPTSEVRTIIMFELMNARRTLKTATFLTSISNFSTTLPAVMEVYRFHIQRRMHKDVRRSGDLAPRILNLDTSYYGIRTFNHGGKSPGTYWTGDRSRSEVCA
jgi:hypothetical protein